MRPAHDLTSIRAAAAAASMVALLTACTATPVGTPESAQHGGYVLHDENTTPRFYHLGRPSGDTIGTLYPDGRNVFLDGKRISDDRTILNGAHVRTGPGSGALVELDRAVRGRCVIEVLEIVQGRLLGHSAECLHNLETPQGTGTADLVATEYHVQLRGSVTELTILNGRMTVRPKSAPATAVTVDRFQEVLLSPDGVVGPRPVSKAEIDQRTRWTRQYEFSRASINSAVIGGAAAGAVLWYLWQRSQDDDDDGPPEDDGPQLEKPEDDKYPQVD